LKGIEFLVANTDLQAPQALARADQNSARQQAYQGLGAGADPESGARLRSKIRQIIEVLEGADMVFVTTGLVAAPEPVALPSWHRSLLIECVDVAVVTKPFHFEGRRRMQQA